MGEAAHKHYCRSRCPGSRPRPQTSDPKKRTDHVAHRESSKPDPASRRDAGATGRDFLLSLIRLS